jgi:hypothetical protein
MVAHLYGLIIKLNPKDVGEGLALIEMSKETRKLISAQEKLFFLRFDDVKLDSDYDDTTLDKIKELANFNMLNLH